MGPFYYKNLYMEDIPTPQPKKKSPITIVLTAAKYSSVLTKVFLLISWVELIEADQEGIDLVFQVVPLPLLWMEG